MKKSENNRKIVKIPGKRVSPDPTKSLLKPTGFSKDEIQGNDHSTELVDRGIAPLTRMRPHIGRLMADAYSIIDSEFRMLREKVEAGEQLNSVEAGKFARYVDSMSKLAKEERMQQQADSMDGKTTEELRELAVEALKALPTPEE